MVLRNIFENICTKFINFIKNALEIVNIKKSLIIRAQLLLGQAKKCILNILKLYSTYLNA